MDWFVQLKVFGYILNDSDLCSDLILIFEFVEERRTDWNGLKRRLYEDWNKIDLFFEVIPWYQRRILKIPRQLLMRRIAIFLTRQIHKENFSYTYINTVNIKICFVLILNSTRHTNNNVHKNKNVKWIFSPFLYILYTMLLQVITMQCV